jgi:hypothetical protein
MGYMVSNSILETVENCGEYMDHGLCAENHPWEALNTK